MPAPSAPNGNQSATSWASPRVPRDQAPAAAREIYPGADFIDAQPFAWTAIADSILQKLARLVSEISGTER